MKKILPHFATLFFCFQLLFFSSPSIAQYPVAPTINEKQEHILKSAINGNTYHLSVSLPMHYAAKDSKQYPVLYMLDGGLSFPIAHAARTSMDLGGELEAVIIVGIEYDWVKSLQPWMTLRWKDFTPFKDAKSDTSQSFLQWFNLTKGDLSSGGAVAYLKVLQEEIIPFIEKKYKTNTDRGISGHSLGGLFAGYCLLTGPKLFQRYGINSPSFWWNNKEMFAVEKSFSVKNTSLPARVFMSVGSLEGASMTPVMTAFADSLKNHNYKGLLLTTHIFEDENHMSVVPAMISRTLRELYGKRKNN